MAIIIEEERRRVNIIRLLGWLSILVIIAAAIYYVFFAAPELVIISPPDGFQKLAPISAVTLHPEDVLNSAPFRALTPPSFPLPTPQGPAAVGRTNPFLP